MPLGWTEDLSVGVELIDKQHKVWFEKADKLFEAGKAGLAAAYVGQMLDFLDEYTKQHFRDEEAYMLKIKYPEYDTQKKLHEGFIVELAKLKKSFEESGGNLLVILNANQMVITWLTNHISVVDKRIGKYVRENNIK